jgi:ubiquinone/menaquinone biosynthesis C-methylase UbiE
MTFYKDRIYPCLVNWLGNPRPVRKLRQHIIPLAQGVVLEIGVGSGANFPYYDPAKVRLLYALEPNPGMLRLAEVERRETALNIRFLDLPGERIPLDDGSVDTVVSTFTLCTIPAVVEAIRGIARVLKPDGRLIFLENSIAADPQVRRWQKWWEPVHHRLFGGLYLTRDILSLLMGARFRIERTERLYLSRFPKSWTHCCWGTAVPPSSTGDVRV